MAPLKAGDSFPENVAFQYIPWAEDKGEITSCGIPIKYDASKEWADKKVVLFSVPGTFVIDSNKWETVQLGERPAKITRCPTKVSQAPLRQDLHPPTSILRTSIEANKGS
jgi:hypothetical protein